MKKMIKCICILFAMLIAYGQDNNVLSQNVNYYYVNNQKCYWQDDSTSINIIVSNRDNYGEIVRKLDDIFTDIEDEIIFDDEDDNIIVNSSKLASMRLDSLVEQISILPEDVEFTTFSKRIDNSRIWLRNEIYVQLRDSSYFNKILPLLDEYSVRDFFYEGDDEYRLKCDDENLMMLLANLLHDDEGVVFATPDFYSNINVTADDTYYPQQWGLQNTGQLDGIPHIDIKAYMAWSYISDNCSWINSGIKVGVVDDGVEPHEDFYYGGGVCKVLDGYTANGSGTGRPRPNGKHGQCCAGIIGAVHNTIGIAGVAPYSLIVPFRIFKNNGKPFSSARIANAIKKAWKDYKVDILSNSWVGGTPNTKLTNSIIQASENGRDGKGCIVVFSSGNDNYANVEYPSNITGVLSVGAIDRCGIRSGKLSVVPLSCDPWCANCSPGSSYGGKLSVMAPGTNVYTIDRMGTGGYNATNYNHLFGGTSAACPHVAGVAALILSVAPNLTSQQVRDIIETTAQKIRPDVYTYSTVQNHSNGTWNNEMGYGLVDAYAAVRKALDSDLYVCDATSDDGTEPSQVTYMWCSPDIWIEDAAGHVVERPQGDADYRVCVKVHNRREIASSGHEKLRLNWVKAGIGTQWPLDWTGETVFDCAGNHVPKGGFIGGQEGVVIPAIPALGYVVVKVPWHTPRAEDYETCSDFGSELWHFCLLARVYDSGEIVGDNIPGYDMGLLTVQNNNVAWKNITLLNSRFNRSVISVANPSLVKQKYRILFKAHPNVEDEYINDFADVYMQLDVPLTNLWEAYGRVSENMREIDRYTMLMGSYNASLENIVIPLEENYSLSVFVEFYAKIKPRNDTLSFDIILCDDKGNHVGGEHYVAIRDADRMFSATARENQIILKGDEVSFTALDIGEPACYKWYDAQGEEVGEGMGLTILPQYSQDYILKVTAESDGYKDFDQVSVYVTQGKIEQINPNPANQQVVIVYSLLGETPPCKLEIMTQMGQTVLSEYVSSEQNQKTFDIHQLQVGHYVVKLVTQDGVFLDAKTLVVQ